MLLVEDHPVTRLGFKAVIDQHPDLMVVAETDDAPQAIQLATSNPRPDVVIVDLSLKTTNGIELTKNLVSAAPDVPVLIVSMHDESTYAERALRAGARGYLMKQEASGKIVDAIRAVLKGELFVSAKIRELLVPQFTGRTKAETVFPTDTLSDREMEVFQLIGEGFSTREIAARLKLSTKTIDSYREHLKQKLSLSSGTELVRRAIEWRKGASLD